MNNVIVEAFSEGRMIYHGWLGDYRRKTDAYWDICWHAGRCCKDWGADRIEVQHTNPDGTATRWLVENPQQYETMIPPIGSNL